MVSVVLLISGGILLFAGSTILFNALRIDLRTFEDEMKRFNEIFVAVWLFGLAFCMFLFGAALC